MNLWHWSARYWRGGTAARTQEVASAYERLFTGHGGQKEAQIVLADLANWTGFYRVNGPEMGADERAWSDGARSAYARIFRFLRLGDDERRQLEEAARAEAIADSQEGPT